VTRALGAFTRGHIGVLRGRRDVLALGHELVLTALFGRVRLKAGSLVRIDRSERLTRLGRGRLVIAGAESDTRRKRERQGTGTDHGNRLEMKNGD
jgi:hypothetical protein